MHSACSGCWPDMTDAIACCWGHRIINYRPANCELSLFWLSYSLLSPLFDKHPMAEFIITFSESVFLLSFLSPFYSFSLSLWSAVSGLLFCACFLHFSTTLECKERLIGPWVLLCRARRRSPGRLVKTHTVTAPCHSSFLGSVCHWFLTSRGAAGSKCQYQHHLLTEFVFYKSPKLTTFILRNIRAFGGTCIMLIRHFKQISKRWFSRTHVGWRDTHIFLHMQNELLADEWRYTDKQANWIYVIYMLAF